ncbi:hypothetical protein GCM10023352_13330 [Rothia endophytica]|uniref:Aminoglycoside phosphotransferase domain-containing protein n=2 Tax=Rothia endophytica TaxID=1324766 RepID=A0ABP9BH94_9MICC
MVTMSASSPRFAALIAAAADAYTPSSTESPVTSAAFARLAAAMLDFAEQTSGCRVGAVEILSAGMRSVVLRLVFESSDTSPGGTASATSSRIVKFFRRRDAASNSGGFGYLREKHGLAALGELVPGVYPQLRASDDGRRTLMMEDLASGASSKLKSCAELMAQGSQQAALALRAYLDLWTAVLRSPAQQKVIEGFRQQLALADPKASSPGSLTSPALVLKGLERMVVSGDLPADHLARVRGNLETLLAVSPHQSVLTSGDFSPLNVVLSVAQPPALSTGNLAVRALDAEGSAWHHPALLIAEVLLGFPSTPGPSLTTYLNERQLQEAALMLAQHIYPGIPTVEELTGLPEVEAALLIIQGIRAEQAGNSPPASN